MAREFFSEVYSALQETDPVRKVFLTGSLSVDLHFEHSDIIVQQIVAGHPEFPKLVDFSKLPKRKINSVKGKAALMHSIAHIEFNAINLALDALYRFRYMPHQYYVDWLKVAKEEAYHFTLVCNYLAAYSVKYGDFVAHNGLWEMAEKTAHDLLVRMALVPRVLEAKGLDATPHITKRLQQADDEYAVSILKVIEKDEILHVAIGTKWFKHLCAERSLEPLETFKKLIYKYAVGHVRLPLACDSRIKAGFTTDDLKVLTDFVTN